MQWETFLKSSLFGNCLFSLLCNDIFPFVHLTIDFCCHKIKVNAFMLISLSRLNSSAVIHWKPIVRFFDQFLHWTRFFGAVELLKIVWLMRVFRRIMKFVHFVSFIYSIVAFRIIFMVINPLCPLSKEWVFVFVFKFSREKVALKSKSF